MTWSSCYIKITMDTSWETLENYNLLSKQKAELPDVKVYIWGYILMKK